MVVAFRGLLGDCRLLSAAALDSLCEAFERADIHALLAEILSGDIHLGLLPGAADGNVRVLPVGLPPAGEDATGLCGEALALVHMHGVSEADVRELARVHVNLAWFTLAGLDRDAILALAGVEDRAGDPVLDSLLPGYAVLAGEHHLVARGETVGLLGQADAV